MFVVKSVKLVAIENRSQVMILDDDDGLVTCHTLNRSDHTAEIVDMRKNIGKCYEIRLAMRRHNFVGERSRKVVVECRMPFLFSIAVGICRFHSKGNGPFSSKNIEEGAVIASNVDDLFAGKPTKA